MVSLRKLEVVDFRSFSTGKFEFDVSGTTVLLGENGSGKTSLVEAIAFLGSGYSFRGTTRDMMIRTGCDRSVIRAELSAGERQLLVEAQIVFGAGAHFQVNRQVIKSTSQLFEVIPAVIFSPNDLNLVQGGPGPRREYLDSSITIVDPPVGQLLSDLDKVLRQRATLLRQSGGRLEPGIVSTLDVWDDRLSELGEAVAAARKDMIERLNPYVGEAYRLLAGQSGGVIAMSYSSTWTPSLSEALKNCRSDDIKRAVNTVGPHRDDLHLEIDGRSLRNQASQGEQRCMALSLKLGFYEMVVQETSTVPILLLDDVFSELDPARGVALMSALPRGQSIVTTSIPLPRASSREHEHNFNVCVIGTDGFSGTTYLDDKVTREEREPR